MHAHLGGDDLSRLAGPDLSAPGERRTVARWSDTCLVPPHPDLLDRWAADLDRAKKRKGAETMSLALERRPRRLGFDDGVIIPPEEFPFGTPSETIKAAAADRAPLRGAVRVIVVLVEFTDKALGQNTQHYEELFFSSGVLPHGSVKEYYTEVTNNLITLDGAVVGPYTMPQTLAWYANNNYGIGQGGGAFRSPQLAHDAAVAADPDVDFKPYDNDGNGFVDAFIVVHAGQGAEVTGNKGDIWSHKSTLASAYATDATKIYGYLTIPEDARIGVCAHELGHLLFGFPDLYDTDYTSEGVGNWCLMSGGSWNGGGDIPAHPSAWCKVNQGWVSVTNVSATGAVNVPDVKASRNVLRLWKNGGAGPEYFLVENRQKTGYDAQLPGDGLLVWHIDENQPGNTDENHYKVGLVQSDGLRDLELKHNRGDAGDPYPGSASKSSLTGSTTPSSKSFAGQDTCVSITNISASGPTMSATVQVSCIVKSPLKDAKDHGKDRPKDLKERPKDLKDAQKDQKELRKDLKEQKDGIKDHQKDGFKERKEGKEVKETFKETKELKEFKEGKEIREWPPDWRPGGGDLGGGGFVQEPGAAGFVGGGDPVLDAIAALDARVAALEQLAGAGVEPFIGADLRPDLIGGPVYPSTGDDPITRMAAGDVDAKREYDAAPAT